MIRHTINERSSGVDKVVEQDLPEKGNVAKPFHSYILYARFARLGRFVRTRFERCLLGPHDTGA